MTGGALVSWLDETDPDEGLPDRLRALGAMGAALPVLDERGADEILGYDVHGLPSSTNTDPEVP